MLWGQWMILDIRKKLRARTDGGFSLIELAILVTIVGLFVSTAAQTYRLYLKKTAYNTTKERMSTLETALGKFVSVNGRLPCPADPAYGVGHPQGGVENCRPAGAAFPTIACTAGNSICRVAAERGAFTASASNPPSSEGQTYVIGTVPSTGDGKDRILRGGIPYTTLGLSPRDAYDGWGSMFSYAVTELLSSYYFLPQANNTNDCEEVCHQVNEGATFSRTAPAGKRFTDVVFASYGTPVGSCPSFAVNPACSASTSVDRLKTAFVGKTSGSISASNGTFGDPCSGTVKKLGVVLRACAATAVVAYNEENSVIVHKTWVADENTDREIRWPDDDSPRSELSPVWPIGIVSHGPDKKGGWNTHGQRSSSCTGGRDEANCDATKNFFVADTLGALTGTLYYDDVGTIRQPLRVGDKWHYSTINAMRNKEGSRVGVGTRTPDPDYDLDVAGSLRAERVDATQFCNPADGKTTECFRPYLIGGPETGPEDVQGASCPGGRMSGIAYGAPICEDKVDLTDVTPAIGECPPSEYLIGFCPNGTRMCREPGGAYPVCP